jgi:hypothetical protein
MIGENGVPVTPDWHLPRPVEHEAPTVPPNIELGSE